MYAAIFLVSNRLKPFHRPICRCIGDHDMGHAAIGRCAVPVLDTGGDNHHVTFGQRAGSLAFLLVKAMAMGYQQYLPVRVRMPVVAATRLENHIAYAKGAGFVFSYQLLYPGSAGKVIGRGLFAAGEYFVVI